MAVSWFICLIRWFIDLHPPPKLWYKIILLFFERTINSFWKDSWAACRRDRAEYFKYLPQHTTIRVFSQTFCMYSNFHLYGLIPALFFVPSPRNCLILWGKTPPFDEKTTQKVPRNAGTLNLSFLSRFRRWDLCSKGSGMKRCCSSPASRGIAVSVVKACIDTRSPNTRNIDCYFIHAFYSRGWYWIWEQLLPKILCKSQR